MAFERGRFGLEYDPRQRDKPSSGLGWVVAVIAFVALVSLAWTLVGRFRSRAEEKAAEAAEAEVSAAESARAAAKAAAKADVQKSEGKGKSGGEAAAKPSAKEWAQTSESEPVAKKLVDADLAKRPVKLRNLLMRLDEAKKRRDVEMEVTTIEQIRALPGSPAADLDDLLARRLGALNVRRLLELRNAQWVKEVVVKRGDVASRIAYENGSTLASLARLNGGNVDKVVIGKKLFVMDHPRFSFVVHRRTRTADLWLNGKFFKRYDIPGPVSGKDGTYELPANPRTFWRSLGVELNAADRAEIEMLMPAKASVIIAEM